MPTDVRIDVTTAISMREAIDLLSRKRKHRLSERTFHRWRLKGLRGVRLKTVRSGRTILTSVEAINQFLNDVAEAQTQDGSNNATIDASTDHQLAELGI